ncbi:hypothetical protein RvY_15401 [Ramazzottius varieornatus]|uniref:Uncharacterized protein n=1 Tax=Ramazzottius varieornatus TaxID=947166 RepID=A0A1D1VWD6_RAMVA|nr:hypothetical protein RvY_15401 [Ramazzottius varieornatus]
MHQRAGFVSSGTQTNRETSLLITHTDIRRAFPQIPTASRTYLSYSTLNGGIASPK